MSADPIAFDTGRMLLDHHGRLAAVEVEAREARHHAAEAAGAAESVAERLDAHGRQLDLIHALAGQQRRVLEYVFGALLAIAGGSSSAWIGQVEAWPHAAQLASSVLVALLSGVAALLIARKGDG